MTKLANFITADVKSLSLQVKFLKAGIRTDRDSIRTLGFQAYPEPEQPAAKTRNYPESIWLLAHKIVAFSQGYVQQAGWQRGILNWIFAREPWWTLESRDLPRYQRLFSRQEWLTACREIATAHQTMLARIEVKRSTTTEDHALLHFLRDSLDFAESMYRHALPEAR